MPCSCDNGCKDGGALGAVQFLTESADPNAKVFPWSMPARYYQKSGRMVIYGTCIVAGTTRKGDTFSKEELVSHGLTLIHGPIEAFTHSWDDDCGDEYTKTVFWCRGRDNLDSPQNVGLEVCFTG